MKLVKLTCLLLALAAPFAQASLIVNGSFEDNKVNAGSWNWFYASQVNGWDGSNIEIWNQFSGVRAADGEKFIELNAHGSNQNDWSIYQTFQTVSGSRYQLSFAYRARVNQNELFTVSVGDLTQTLTDHTTGEWRLFSGYFTAGNTTSLLRFTSGNSGTYGNFIDNVQVNQLAAVTAKNQVPAGPTSMLLMIATAALFWRRRQA